MSAKREAVVTLTRPGRTACSRVIFRATTVRRCEREIKRRAKRDPDGVARGDYGIDASERAHAEYQRLRNRMAWLAWLAAALPYRVGKH